MSPSPLVQVVTELTSRGYNADREAVTLLARASDPAAAVARVLDAAPENALTLSADHVRAAIDTTPDRPRSNGNGTGATDGSANRAERGATTDGGAGATNGGETPAMSEDPVHSAGTAEAVSPTVTASAETPDAANPSVSSGDITASDERLTKSPEEAKGLGTRARPQR